VNCTVHRASSFRRLIDGFCQLSRSTGSISAETRADVVTSIITQCRSECYVLETSLMRVVGRYGNYAVYCEIGTRFVFFYEGRSINKLQNDIILLIFKI